MTALTEYIVSLDKKATLKLSILFRGCHAVTFMSGKQFMRVNLVPVSAVIPFNSILDSTKWDKHIAVGRDQNGNTGEECVSQRVYLTACEH